MTASFTGTCKVACSLAVALLSAPLAAQEFSARREIGHAAQSPAPLSGAYAEEDSVAFAAGLMPLRLKQLPRGEREARIWIQSRPYWPERLFRFEVREGQVRGEEIIYWLGAGGGAKAAGKATEDDRDLILYDLRGGCDRLAAAGSIGTCRTRFTAKPNWADVLRRAEADGLWELPDQSSLPPDTVTRPDGRFEVTLPLDGWYMLVELRTGPSYRTYEYGEAGPNPRRAADARAARVVRALRGIDSLRAPSNVVRTYRGRTSGQYRSAFYPCDGGPVVEFHSSLSGRTRPASIAPPAVTADSADFFVELMGELSPEWLAREWGSKFRRVLQVIELRRVEPWTADACHSKPAPAR